MLAQFCAAHDATDSSFNQSLPWDKQSWCYIPCDKSVCTGFPRTQTAYLWRATVNNVDLCYSYEVCGGVDFFTGKVEDCVESGGYYLDNVCKCDVGEHMALQNGAEVCATVRVPHYARNTSQRATMSVNYLKSIP